MATEPPVCQYLDMPLQHISDRMLRAMRREKSGGGIRRLLDRLRASIPGVVLRTSFIVGFPGEQEEDFRQLLDFVSAATIDHVGVFRYSQEEGTDRKSTRLNSSHDQISYAVFCLKKKKIKSKFDSPSILR